MLRAMEITNGQTSNRSHGHALVAVLVAVASAMACSSKSSTGSEGNTASDGGSPGVEDGGGNASSDGSTAADGSTADGSTPPPVTDSSSNGSGPDASDGTTSSCASSDTDAGTCNSVEATGLGVVSTCASGEPPQAQGGAIANGVYVLESSTFYGGCPATPEATRSTWAICGSEWDLADVQYLVPTDLDAGILPALHANFTADVASSSVSFTAGCETETASLAARPYTATSTQLTFIYSDSAAPGAIHVSVYTRQ
jgi:hypothetical protein